MYNSFHRHDGGHTLVTNGLNHFCVSADYILTDANWRSHVNRIWADYDINAFTVEDGHIPIIAEVRYPPNPMA